MTKTGPRTEQKLIIKSFAPLPDPRRTEKGNFRYPLTEIIFLVISAVISNANDWTSIESFGKKQLKWLRKFLPYKNGTPSHDILGELFANIDSEKFCECFLAWVNSILEINDGEVIAIDGKRIRGSYDSGAAKAAIHMVSAFATGSGICLGQVATEEKSNEITAIPMLLDILAIKGCTVTLDAMGCQKEIAGKIIEGGADYVIAIKENQKNLAEQARKMFDLKKGDTYENTDSGHGRIEVRKCTVIDNLAFFDDKEQWPGLKSVIRIKSERIDKLHGKSHQETRFYISSHKAEAQKLNKIVRKHWAIENQLHWVLDMTFNEDASRRRKNNSASNFNLISKIALALLKMDNDKKKSLKKKRYEAALDPEYREKLLKT